MANFDKFPVSRPHPGRDLLVKLTLDGATMKAVSEQRKSSGVILRTGEAIIASNDIAFWQYAETNAETATK